MAMSSMTAIRQRKCASSVSTAELGAPIEEALVQYYPSELECLTEGLIQYVQSAL